MSCIRYGKPINKVLEGTFVGQEIMGEYRWLFTEWKLTVGVPETWTPSDLDTCVVLLSDM